MPAVRYDLIGSIPGTIPTGGGGPESPTDAPTVSITFYRCGETDTREAPPYTSPGVALEVMAEFQWSRVGSNTEVFGFTGGDVQAIAEDDPAVEDLIQLGSASRAGVAFGPLGGGSNGLYTLPLILNPNSAGTIHITVLSLVAWVVVGTGQDAENSYGPFIPITASFSYSTLSGTVATNTKPEVDIVTPTDPIFNQATAPITLLWNEEIRQNATRSIGPDDDDDIKITGGTYDAAAGFAHTARTMAFNVTLSGQGTCTIRVKANSETDIGGDTGPAEDTSESFLYDTSLSISGDDTPETDAIPIYDSGSQPFTSSTNTLLSSEDGAFKGVSDLKLIDGNFYGIAQIQKSLSSSTLNQGQPARAVLFKRANSNSDITNITILRSYDSIVEASRSLSELGNRVYMFDGSHPFSGDGTLQSVSKTSNAVSNHGIPWRSRLINPNAQTRDENESYSRHIRMASPMATVNSNLYLSPGYGAIRSAKSIDWESSQNPEGLDAPETRIDNWTLLKFGTNLDFRPSVVQTNDKIGYNIIQELAELCFCYIGFDGSTFIMRPKFQPKAQTIADINIGDPVRPIAFQNQNMEFPNSGFLRIAGQTGNKELFQYSSIGMNTFTITGRALYGTAADDHCAEASIEYVKHVLDVQDAAYRVVPINELNFRQDLQQLYNIIKIRYGDQSLDLEEISRNAASVRNNKPRELELTVNLDHHDSEWVSWLAQRYNDFYSNIRYLLELELKPSFYLRSGDFIILKEPRNSLINNQVFQILRLTHEIKPYRTSVQLRSIPE